ncbi:selenide, water dikinase SelD [Aliivibrio kagoshimensis]
MAQVLRTITPLFPEADYPNLMVGLAGSDDAAVYKVNDDVAVIQTLDFFTPIVDDPYDFGAIAAANSLSDVYAMGGQATLAMNIFCVPPDLPQDIVEQILKGGADKVREAGAVLVGGHTVEDSEPKFGLSVMGIIHPSKVQTKGNVEAGDVLVLTKPIGTGIISTAAKRNKASESSIDASTQSMKMLNSAAAKIFANHPIKACTDITGYALIGHGVEMAEKSGVCLHFNVEKVPFLEGAEEYAVQNLFPGGAKRNLEAYEGQLVFADELADSWQLKLCCPETSGGLLAAVPAAHVDDMLKEFSELGEQCWIVGHAEEGEGIRIS